MQTKIALLAAMLVLLSGTVLWAQSHDDPSRLAAMLEPMLEKCDWKVRNLTGGPKGVMLLHQAKMRRILGELKAGQLVDSKEIHEIMKEHSS
ncbi:MAG: hypothetical protein HY695_02660 [Deltaproteobacteria bacterium]|nr:hypothetical protein [Deltaproteobacteria bacterium]